MRGGEWGIVLLVIGMGISGCGIGQGPPPDCVARCGMPAFGMSQCEDYSATVDECLDAYSAHVHGWNRDTLCQKLQGWRVYVRQTDGGSFTGADGETSVAGQTWLDYASVEVSDVPWHRGALCHELGHVFENALDNRVDYAHRGWKENGIYAGIDDARKRGIQRAEGPPPSEK